MPLYSRKTEGERSWNDRRTIESLCRARDICHTQIRCEQDSHRHKVRPWWWRDVGTDDLKERKGGVEKMARNVPKCCDQKGERGSEIGGK